MLISNKYYTVGMTKLESNNSNPCRYVQVIASSDYDAMRKAEQQNPGYRSTTIIRKKDDEF